MADTMPLVNTRKHTPPSTSTDARASTYRYVSKLDRPTEVKQRSREMQDEGRWRSL